MDDIFQFEGFRLDRRGLFRRDERGVLAPMAIGSRALGVLGVLVGRSDERRISASCKVGSMTPATLEATLS